MGKCTIKTSEEKRTDKTLSPMNFQGCCQLLEYAHGLRAPLAYRQFLDDVFGKELEICQDYCVSALKEPTLKIGTPNGLFLQPIPATQIYSDADDRILSVCKTTDVENGVVRFTRADATTRSISPKSVMPLPGSVPVSSSIPVVPSDRTMIEQPVNSSSGMMVSSQFSPHQEGHTSEENSLFVVPQPLAPSSPNLECTPTVGCDPYD